MSWAEVSKVNSNFVNEPLNFNNYIYDISVFGSDSYVMDVSNSDLWLELMSKSLAVYGHDMIHEFLYERITEDDADYIVRNHSRLGQAFNSFYNTNLFKAGNIDAMLSGITQEAWGLLEVKFQDALNKYINEKASDTSVGSWLAEIFDVSELADYTSISDIFSDVELYDDYIADNESLLLVIANSAIATVFVSETLSITNTKFQTFIESVAASIPATMQMITALKAYDKLNAFFANENCCDKIVESEQAMKAMLYSIDGFEAMVSSQTAMQKIVANEVAVDIIVQATEDVANSSNALTNIKGVLPEISTNLGNILDTEPMIESVENTVDVITDTLSELDKVLNKMDILGENIDALFDSSTAMTAIANSSTAMNKIKDSKSALRKVYDRSMARNIFYASDVAKEAIHNSSLITTYDVTNSGDGGYTLLPETKTCILLSWRANVWNNYGSNSWTISPVIPVAYLPGSASTGMVALSAATATSNNLTPEVKFFYFSPSGGKVTYGQGSIVVPTGPTLRRHICKYISLA